LLTLANLLHPLTVSDFLLQHFGVRPVCVAGPANRFAGFVNALPEIPSSLVADLIRNLEFTLEAPVRYQLLADWKGYPLHRCEQDLFVLQVTGQAAWSFRGNALKPSEPITWQDMLKDGGALYLPKGWWCAAAPQPPPSCILVLSIDNPTGADLLTWLVRQLKTHEIVRANIPRFGSPAVKGEYLIAMRRVLEQTFRSPALLEQYMRHVDEAGSCLDTSPLGVAWREDLPCSYRIVIVTRRSPRIRRLNEAMIYLSVTGRDLPFSTSLAPLIQYLLDKAPACLADFCRDFADEFEREKLFDLLSVLSTNGVIAFTAPDEAC
jgi:hypothetical protein